LPLGVHFSPGHANSPELADIAPAGIFAMEAMATLSPQRCYGSSKLASRWDDDEQDMATLEHAQLGFHASPPGKNITALSGI